ncbi:MAG: carboxypeptidase-like regulatory domain-containing protein, partial [Bacteroidales bacterium]|nr:carboxypeptidase-like regulatory domain-containing protein [Bacteroidales bacterium]
MSEKWRHIMQDGHCPDEPVIRKYLNGKLAAAQQFEIENHLAACDSCRDFAEGLAMLSDEQMTRHEIEIKDFIRQKLSSKPSKKVLHPYKRIAVAASILLVLSVGTLLWFTAIRPSQSRLAYKEAPQEPAEKTKNDLPVSVDKTTMDAAPDSAEERAKTEETIVRPAPVPNEIIVLELADHEEEFLNLADNEGFIINEDREALVPETITTASRTTLTKVQPLTTATKKPIQKVQGQVVEASTGAPLPGAAVTIKGTTTFALTDTDGHFEIPVKDQTGILEFSFIGFDNVTIPLADSTQFKIEMKENLLALDEVVVVGYGVQKKRMVTGAVTMAEKKSSPPKKNREQDI